MKFLEDMLQGVGPSVALGRNTAMLREMLDRTAERVGKEMTNQPAFKAELRNLIGTLYRQLGNYPRAEEMHRAALVIRRKVFGPGSPEVAVSLIPMLAGHFVAIYSKRMCKCVKEVPVETMDALLSYSWPGNVRELQNVIERAVILSPDRILTPSLDELNQSTRMTNELEPGTNRNRATLTDVQREHIIQALAATNWVLGGPKGAGARLGLARTTLIGKMRKLGICRDQ
jgi:formate hydrogenlyase transcriptional activator